MHQHQLILRKGDHTVLNGAQLFARTGKGNDKVGRLLSLHQNIVINARLHQRQLSRFQKDLPRIFHQSQIALEAAADLPGIGMGMAVITRKRACKIVRRYDLFDGNRSCQTIVFIDAQAITSRVLL